MIEKESNIEKIDKVRNLHLQGVPLAEACSTVGWTKYQYYNKRRETGHKPERVKRAVITKTNLRWFNIIDSEEKAYFLGFIAADGCITRPNSNRSSDVLAVKIKESDKYLLDILCNLISPERKVIIVENKTSLSNQCENSAFWSVNSNELVLDLLKHGIKFNKSKVGLDFPINLDKNLIRHYIRGFFDGNGYVSYAPQSLDHKRKCSFNIVSTCYDYLVELNKQLPIDCKIYNVTKKDRNMSLYRLSAFRSDSLCVIYYYLYSNSTIFLKRKFKTFSEMTNILGNPVLTNTLKSISNVESSN